MNKLSLTLRFEVISLNDCGSPGRLQSTVFGDQMVSHPQLIHYEKHWLFRL